MVAKVTIEALADILSRINTENPALAADEKVRRYVLILLEEWRKLPAGRAPIAPVDQSDL